MPELRDTCPHCRQPMPLPPDVETRECALTGCSVRFVPTDHKQIFCSANHRLRGHRAGKKAAAKAPRVLSADERRARVDARIPFGVAPRKIEPEKRTLEFFAEPTSTRIRGQTATNPAENARSSSNSRSSIAGGNARETQPTRKAINARVPRLAHDVVELLLETRTRLTKAEINARMRELPRWQSWPEKSFAQMVYDAINSVIMSGKIAGSFGPGVPDIQYRACI